LTNGQIIFYSDVFVPFLSKVYIIYLNILQTQKSIQNENVESDKNDNKIDISSETFTGILGDLSRFKKSDYHSLLKLIRYFMSKNSNTSKTDLVHLRNFEANYIMLVENTLLNYFDTVKDKEKLAKGKTIDQATMLHNLEKALEYIVTDEYTKEAVEDQKIKELNEIQQLFGYGNVDEIDEEQKSLSKTKGKLKKIGKKLIKFMFRNTRLDELNMNSDLSEGHSKDCYNAVIELFRIVPVEFYKNLDFSF